MSIETDLCAVLSAQCPRVFPDVAPYGTERPYVTYQQIGGEAPSYGDDTVMDVLNAHMQVNVWADGRLQANNLMRQIEAALIAAAPFTARPLGALVAAHSESDDLRGAQQDFSIWAQR